ncbi:MAG: hypothetical protein ACKVW3_11465 [Phycisphaerales bacterium]
MSLNSERRRALDPFPAKAPAAVGVSLSRPTVEFRRTGKKDDRVVFPFSQLIWVNFNASYGIIVHFASHTVHIQGTNLDTVYEGLRDQTLRQVQMEDSPKKKGEPHVERIYVVSKSSGDPGFTPLAAADLDQQDA